MVDMCMASKVYVVHEYIMPCIGFCYMIIIIIPNQWKSNCLIWSLCIIYYAQQVYSKYGYLSVSFWISFTTSIMYFTVSSLVLFSKLQQLYEYIHKTETMRMDMKRLLEVFPNGVLILTKDQEDERVNFTNREFDKQFVSSINCTLNFLTT